MVTKAQLEEMRGYGLLYHKTQKDSQGNSKRIKLTGKLKTWKTKPLYFQQPVKFDLYQYGYLEPHNAPYWLTSPQEEVTDVQTD